MNYNNIIKATSYIVVSIIYNVKQIKMQLRHKYLLVPIRIDI